MYIPSLVNVSLFMQEERASHRLEESQRIESRDFSALFRFWSYKKEILLSRSPVKRIK